MKRSHLVVLGCCALVVSVALFAFADGPYTLQDAGVSTGGTTGESANFRASTLMSESVSSQASSTNYGMTVAIPEAEIRFVSDVPQDPDVVRRYALGDNFPNPFNPRTTIDFELARSGAVNLHIYDVSGRLVRVLLDGTVFEAGQHQAVWQGRDSAGQPVASGTYFYRLDSASFSETRRMVLLK